ncbi:Mis12-Mtw1 protein family-domain-containing protein [Mycena leptocephala]|nr:Mis12-Mtw1 protein family-domain-containing protein [Mycena leptocephala]
MLKATCACPSAPEPQPLGGSPPAMATKGDAGNPLLAAKKQKKGVASTGKRKYNEETPGGLLIVRAPRNDAQTRSVPERQPKPGPSSPPAKKFKADGFSVPPQPARNASVDPVVEKDVREMEDEGDRLRHTTIDPSLASMSFRPSLPEKPPPKPKSTRSKKRLTIVDTEVPLLDGTPQAERNKILRSTANGRDGRTPDPELDPKTHQRRSSLGGRGKRISNLFQAGAFALPHPKVHEESFYKHIDRDLPDAEQLRQLLIWSASRAASSSSASKLPPEDASALKTIANDMARMLAERRIDLSLFGPDDEDAPKGTNAQNEKNKQWEVVYSEQLRQGQEEGGEWKETAYFYEAYAATERRRINERRRARADPVPDESALPEPFRRGLHLSQAPPSTASEQIRARLPELRFKFDMLYTNLHAARTCARVTGRALDARFGLLSTGLAARSEPRPSGSGSGEAAAMETHGLMRALARVDMERPPAMVEDAARRPVREVQRATAAGEGE